VDPGPNYPPAKEALVKGLEKLGLGLERFETLFLTHPHVDHYGLAGEIASRSGARVVAHADAVPRLTGRISESSPGQLLVFGKILARAGLPGEFLASLLRQWAASDRLGAAVKVDVLPADGDTVEGGGVTWKIIHTPGHSPGSVCFHDEVGQRLIAGDHLLPHITSNAIMEFREVSPGAAPVDAAEAGPVDVAEAGVLIRERSLEIYIQSLRRVEALDVGEVLPGHGAPFTGHRVLIARRMRHYERRKSAIAAILGRLGPSPAFGVALALFPDQGEPTGQFLALSEALGHLDLLEADGRVRRTETREVDLYSLV
jgi:glyoxylase-like metal-dependent hydrolase (beta-lactamase superfamily II)